MKHALLTRLPKGIRLTLRKGLVWSNLTRSLENTHKLGEAEQARQRKAKTHANV